MSFSPVAYPYAKWGFSCLNLYKLVINLYKLVIFSHTSTKVGDKVYILLLNSCVKFHFKICTHCWNINISWRDCFLTHRVDGFGDLWYWKSLLSQKIEILSQSFTVISNIVSNNCRKWRLVPARSTYLQRITRCITTSFSYTKNVWRRSELMLMIVDFDSNCKVVPYS